MWCSVICVHVLKPVNRFLLRYHLKWYNLYFSFGAPVILSQLDNLNWCSFLQVFDNIEWMRQLIILSMNVPANKSFKQNIKYNTLFFACDLIWDRVQIKWNKWSYIFAVHKNIKLFWSIISRISYYINISSKPVLTSHT